MWQAITFSWKIKESKKRLSKIIEKVCLQSAFRNFQIAEWWKLSSNPISLVEKRFTTFWRFLLGGKLHFRSIKSLPLSWFGFRSSHLFHSTLTNRFRVGCPAFPGCRKPTKTSATGSSTSGAWPGPSGRTSPSRTSRTRSPLSWWRSALGFTSSALNVSLKRSVDWQC